MDRERLERYDLTGSEGDRAVAAGLAGGDWFRSDVPRKRMKELMRRSDYPAIRDTAIWIGGMVVFGALGFAFWGSGLALPFFLAYGVLYGSGPDSRWHECGHGTAFKTRWMNDTVYQLASFMIMRDPTTWRWSHTRHHLRQRRDGIEIRFGLGSDGRLLSAAGVGSGNAVTKDIRVAEMLIAARATPDHLALSDPTVNLKKLLRTE